MQNSPSSLPPGASAVGSPEGQAHGGSSFCRVIQLFPLSFQPRNGCSFLQFLISGLPRPLGDWLPSLFYNLDNQFPAFYSFPDKLSQDRKSRDLKAYVTLGLIFQCFDCLLCFPCKMQLMVPTPRGCHIFMLMRSLAHCLVHFKKTIKVIPLPSFSLAPIRLW